MKWTLITCFLLVVVGYGCGAAPPAAQSNPAVPEPTPRITVEYHRQVFNTGDGNGYVCVLKDNQNGREFIVITSYHGHAIVETKP